MAKQHAIKLFFNPCRCTVHDVNDVASLWRNQLISGFPEVVAYARTVSEFSSKIDTPWFRRFSHRIDIQIEIRMIIGIPISSWSGKRYCGYFRKYGEFRNDLTKQCIQAMFDHCHYWNLKVAETTNRLTQCLLHFLRNTCQSGNTHKAFTGARSRNWTGTLVLPKRRLLRMSS